MLNVLTLIDGTNKKLFVPPPFFKGKTHPMQSELKWKKNVWISIVYNEFYTWFLLVMDWNMWDNVLLRQPSKGRSVTLHRTEIHKLTLIELAKASCSQLLHGLRQFWCADENHNSLAMNIMRQKQFEGNFHLLVLWRMQNNVVNEVRPKGLCAMLYFQRDRVRCMIGK